MKIGMESDSTLTLEILITLPCDINRHAKNTLIVAKSGCF